MNSTTTSANDSISSSSTVLKRTWSLTHNGTQATGTTNNASAPPSQSSGVPPIPKIGSAETLLQVLTHSSLRRFDEATEEFDNERLAELGTQALDTAITAILFNRQPVLTGQELLEQRRNILSNENYDGWVSMYRLRERVRCVPDFIPSLHTIEETRKLFHAYVGGLYREGGLDPVLKWMQRLVFSDSSTNTSIESSAEASGPPPYHNSLITRSPPQKRIKSEPAPIFFAAQPPPSSVPNNMMSRFTAPPSNAYIGHSQPQIPAVTMTQTQSFPNPLTPFQPNLAFLPLFNQTATQRRVTVEYPAEFSGPSHAGRWTVKCVVNGIMKGLGTGASKQVAKEEAARQAWYNLGWS